MIEHRKIPARKATYKGGREAPVHRWFRLTPSFGPELVQRVLDVFQVAEGATVLDPFSGAGTTLIEARLRGLRAWGFEINPLLHFVGSTSLHWDLDPGEGLGALDAISQHTRDEQRRLAGKTAEASGLRVPPIHNVGRWWRPDVLKDLLLLKEAIARRSPSPPWERFFRLALAAVLVPDLTNVTLGRLQLHFIDRAGHDIDALTTFREHAGVMLADVAGVHGRAWPEARVLLTDATDPRVPPGVKADVVITSPPYPNRYSYVWNTRPHLYMLDFFTGKSDAGALDLKTIGGTWGAATNILKRGTVEPASAAVERAAGPVIAEVRGRDTKMGNYVARYFNQLAGQIAAMDRVLTPRARVAYVVGNSCIKDVYIETDALLGKLFEGMGYRVQGIERFRKRNSGVDLYESTVFAERTA